MSTGNNKSIKNYTINIGGCSKEKRKLIVT